MIDQDTITIGLAGGLLTISITATIYLNKQFNTLKDLVIKKFEELRGVFESKLEYHERHDNQRFSQVESRLYQINNEIWQLRLDYNASTPENRNKRRKTSTAPPS